MVRRQGDANSFPRSIDLQRVFDWRNVVARRASERAADWAADFAAAGSGRSTRARSASNSSDAALKPGAGIANNSGVHAFERSDRRCAECRRTASRAEFSERIDAFKSGNTIGTFSSP
jgi:hypothetical protein